MQTGHADPADIPLAAEFPQATREQWLTLVDDVLKGGSFEKLVSTTADGLRIEPLPPRAYASSPILGRTPGESWQVIQRIDHPDAAVANAQALIDLANGATGLALVFAGATSAREFGLEPSFNALDRTLADIHLEAGIAIELEIGPQSRAVLPSIFQLLKQRGIAPSDIELRMGMDPLGACAVWGHSPYAWEDVAKTIGDGVKAYAEVGFRGPFFAADGRVVSDAGGSEAQELAFVLGSAIAYLRALEAAGVAIDAARHMIYARMSADADQFLTLSKFRALRKLWARVEAACGLTPEPLFIAAETAWRMLTKRDIAVNMLRATTATFSAGLGGANSITVLPHTLAIGLPDNFARRIARNTQLVLLEECHLAKVTDPAAGSGIIEQLTGDLCNAAWTLFQEIESAGGLFLALEKNVLQSKIKTVQDRRAKRIAERRDALTGTSEFPNLQEHATNVLDVRPVVLPAYGGGAIHSHFKPLAPMRFSMPFEILRDRSDDRLRTIGQRPRIFLANLGAAADFTPRAQFAKSFFESGGIEALDNDGFTNTDDLVAAFKASGAELACLCSTDTIYDKRAENAAIALTKVGAARIYLAGRPGALKDRYVAAGVGEFIFPNCDALATLSYAYDKLDL